MMCSFSGAHQGRPRNMSLVLLLSHCLHLLLFLFLSPRDVICACHAFWLVVSHGLKCVDKVYELEATIDILIISLNPIDDINMLDFRGASELGEENPQIIAVNLTMSILVNHSEDRQDRIVELADELLLKHLNSLQAFNLSAQNVNFIIRWPVWRLDHLLLNHLHYSVLDVI